MLKISICFWLILKWSRSNRYVRLHFLKLLFFVLTVPALTEISPLRQKGAANSTPWQFGKNFADYSYAAGYSTIKATKSRSS